MGRNGGVFRPSYGPCPQKRKGDMTRLLYLTSPVPTMWLFGNQGLGEDPAAPIYPTYHLLGACP
ncbi:hypothetical protein PanWU01x14_223480, partial [Parasponia andersonii]